MKTKPLTRFRPRCIPRGMLTAQADMPQHATTQEDPGERKNQTAPSAETAENSRQALPGAKGQAASENAYEADTAAVGLKFETPLPGMPQSMVRDGNQRSLPLPLDALTQGVRTRAPESSGITLLASCYHSLLRMWGGA